MREFYAELGRRLRESRRAANLSQAELAQRVGLARTSITNIEKGRQQVPLHLFLSLAGAVDVDPSVLTPSMLDSGPRASLPANLLKGLAPADQELGAARHR